jgi:hypothetical protein
MNARLVWFEPELYTESKNGGAPAKWSPEQAPASLTAAADDWWTKTAGYGPLQNARKVSRGAKSHLDDDDMLYNTGDGQRWVLGWVFRRTFLERIESIRSIPIPPYTWLHPDDLLDEVILIDHPTDSGMALNRPSAIERDREMMRQIGRLGVSGEVLGLSCEARGSFLGWDGPLPSLPCRRWTGCTGRVALILDTNRCAPLCQ